MSRKIVLVNLVLKRHQLKSADGLQKRIDDENSLNKMFK